MKDSQPSMRDVAQIAGVSLKTVSRVVNGEPHVNLETANRVQDAIKRLGFRPNALARSLRQGQATATLGVLIEDLANPFYSQVARGVEMVAAARGCLVLTASSEEDPRRERELVSTFLDRRVDGLVLVPSRGDHSYLHEELRGGTPVVFVDRPPLGYQADTILLENRAAARRGVEHLLSRGHRHIGFVGGFAEVYTGAERFAGYSEALQAAGVPLEPGLIQHESHDLEHSEQALYALMALEYPPTAVFTTSNRQTLGVLRGMYRQGARLEVVGFDDLELADFLPISLSVLRHDPVQLGRHAAQRLFSRLEGNQDAFEHIIFPVELVIRNV